MNKSIFMANFNFISFLKGKPSNVRVIFIGTFSSIVLLIIFMSLQYHGSTLLKLDQRWLILSSIPILISLILSGITKSIKGLGFELEFSLSEPLPSGLIAPIEYIQVDEIGKGSIEFLNTLSEVKKTNVGRLQFILGLRNYYDEYAVREYFNAFPKLKYIEIINETGQFLCLKAYKREEDHRVILTFIREIEDRSFLHSKDVITDYISQNDSVISAYKKINSSNQGKVGFGASQYLPVLDGNRKMAGIIYKNKLAETIAQSALNAFKS